MKRNATIIDLTSDRATSRQRLGPTILLKTTRGQRRKSISRREGLPKAKKVTMRYCTSVNLNPSAGGRDAHVFRANGLFDPDQSGIGHQPYGFDQWMAFYHHYTVTSSKITVTYLNTQVTDSPASRSICGIHLDTSATAVTTNLDLLREQKDTRWGFTGQQTDKVNVNTKFGSTVFFGRPSTNSEFLGTAASNPEDEAYYHVWVAADASGQDPAVTTCIVTLDYDVTLREVKNLPLS